MELLISSLFLTQVSNSSGDNNARKQLVSPALTSSSDNSLLPNWSIHWAMDEIARGITLANNIKFVRTFFL